MLNSMQSRIKKGTGSSLPSSANASSATASNIGGGKDGTSKSSEPDVSPLSNSGNAPSSETDGSQKVKSPSLPETEKASGASLSQTWGAMNALSTSLPEGESGFNMTSISLSESVSTSLKAVSADQGQKVLLAAPRLHQNNPVDESKKLNMQNDAKPENI